MQPARLFIFATLSFIFISVACALTTSPLLIWSSTNYFPQSGQYFETLKFHEVDSVFKACLGLPTTPIEGLENYFPVNSSPELVLVFIEPKFHSEQLAELSSAYDVNPGQGSSLKNLKNSIESSKSSIVFPYTLGLSQQSLLNSTLTLRRSFPTSSITLVRNKDSRALQSLASDSNTKTMTQQQFLEDNKMGDVNKGVTDVVIFAFDDSEPNSKKVSQDDEFIGSVAARLKEKTQNFVALFTSDEIKFNPLHMIHPQIDSHHFRAAKMMMDTGADPGYFDTFWPIAWIQGLFAILILLVIAFVGICCTCTLQSPVRFETPKQRRQDIM